jgi:arginine deiminase
VLQEREQWTDGANAVCVAPGRIILYSRNASTIEALRDHGFEASRLSVVQSRAQRAEIVAEGMARPRTVFSFSGSELSRARGGGRCLTMPLRREVDLGG